MFLGIGKTSFNSSVAKVEGSKFLESLEVQLTERISREKASGKWPLEALKSVDISNCNISDNRDIQFVTNFEEELETKTPFYLYLQKIGLLEATNKNKNIETLGHHYCHALAAQAFSPYKKALIVVRDGAGNKIKDLKKSVLCNGEEKLLIGSDDENEMLSVYKLESGKITCLEKKFQTFSFKNGFSVSNGMGIIYEAVATYIFNNKRAAGKVMGLAPFGKHDGSSVNDLLEMFTPREAFVGKSKEEWESSPYIDKYKTMAAIVQELFEKESFEFLHSLKVKYPEYSNIILTGGTALNCVFNMKLVDTLLFTNVYVPPFPGDECIGVGAAAYQFLKNYELPIFPIKKQHGYFGKKENIPNEAIIRQLFKDDEIFYFKDIEAKAAEILNEGNIIAWFQGRSESGPRALGNRSILAPLGKSGIKDYLNQNIKFREDFRPYGGTFLKEKAVDYFEISDGFYSPFMSFALKVKQEKVEEISEISHIDGTSRAQILTFEQNPIFWNLINEYGKLSNIFGVLNTSLNIMSEPIVENLIDLQNFFKQSQIKYCVAGNYLIRKIGE